VPEQRRAVVVVHVHDGQARLPVGGDGVRLGEVVGGMDDEHAVVQRQLDQVHDRQASAALGAGSRDGPS
jgi:hypothetical protein